MAWTILVLSGALEAVWALALAASDRFRRPWPTVVFALAAIASLAGLAVAMQSIPVGTAYAVWVGIGATLTVLVSTIRGTERLTTIRMLLLALLVGCVVALKAVS
ncbi:MAG: DMT family transporter [Propioniciclava sp.]